MVVRHRLTDIVDEGVLDTGDGHRVAWTVAGNPEAKPAVLLHGGPGAGSSPNTRRLFDPDRYLLVQFDQRGCGASTPNASGADVDLSTNTTQHLIGDIERLRIALDIDRWLVWGGSWGSTLGLAYAQAHPEAVSELVLNAVTTTSAAEVEWITRTVGRIFPEGWKQFVELLPPGERSGNLAAAYNRLLMDPDPTVHAPAATAWCRWEDVHVSLTPGYRPHPRFDDADFRLSFARLVTHYWANAGFLAEGRLLRDVDRLADVPVFMAHGRRDVSGPLVVAHELHQALPRSELFVAEDDGHGGTGMTEWTAALTDRLAGH